jgi:hypothetical protein
VPAEKKKRDNGVGVVDAGARPLAPWSMQAALSLSREVWEAWGLAATSVKMLWKERLCTICVVPAPRGRCLCTHSSRTMAHARKEKRAVNDFHTMDEEWEWEWEWECGHCRAAEPGPGQGAKRRRPPVGNWCGIWWTGAGSFRGSFAICPVWTVDRQKAGKLAGP